MSNYLLIAVCQLTSELVIFNRPSRMKMSLRKSLEEQRRTRAYLGSLIGLTRMMWTCSYSSVAFTISCPFPTKKLLPFANAMTHGLFSPKRRWPGKLTKRCPLFYRNRPVHSLDSIIPLESTTPYNMTDVVLEVTFKSTSCLFVQLISTLLL